MDVRCPACGTEASQWAANCPSCGSSLAGAVPVQPGAEPEPAEDLEVGRSRRWWFLAVGVSVGVAVVAVTAGALAWRSSGGPGAPSRVDVAKRQLFYAEPDQTLMVRGDGRIVVRSFANVEGDGYPARPLTTADGAALFIHGHQAYRVGPGANTARPVGPADRLIPADGGEVGLLVNGVGSGSGSVTYVGGRAAPSEPLPRDTTPIARLVTGLLVLGGDGHLRFAGGARSLDLGPVDSILGTFVATVAWTSHDGCAPFPPLIGCPLHLSETGSGQERALLPPVGYRGFAGGGGFSPDGSHLAAFVFAGTEAAPAVRPVLITTRTGDIQLLGPVLSVGEPLGSAAWSPDGRWLFFCGLSGPMYAQPVGARGGAGPAVALPLPASYAFVAL